MQPQQEEKPRLQTGLFVDRVGYRFLLPSNHLQMKYETTLAITELMNVKNIVCNLLPVARVGCDNKISIAQFSFFDKPI